MVVLQPTNRDYSELEMVAIMGDVHGQAGWIDRKVGELAQQGIKLVLQIGDWGLWPGKTGATFLHRVERSLAAYDMEMLVLLGNHDEWPRALKLWENPKRIAPDGSPIPIQLTPNIQIQPRGWRFELNGVSFLSFGGAASIDFEYRQRGNDWWPEEMPSWEEVDEACAGGYADVMLVHETVDQKYAVHKVVNMLQHNPQGWSTEALAYSNISRARTTKLFEAVKPRLLFHGHMHEFGIRRVELAENYGTMVVSVDKDYEEYNIMILDLDAFKIAKETDEYERVFGTPAQIIRPTFEEAWVDKT